MPISPRCLAAQISPEQARAADYAADESRAPYPRNVLAALLGFDEEHLQRLDAGEVVLGNTLYDEGDEFAVAGALRVEGDRETFVRTMHPAWRFQGRTPDASMGVFSDPPQVSDLSSMRMGPKMIDEVRRCRPGRCGIQLTSQGIAALQESVDWSVPGYEEEVERRARTFLIERLRDYQQYGYADAFPFADARQPIDRVAEFNQLLGHAMVQAAQEPRLHRYLADYPRAPRDGIEDTFYWIRTEGSGSADPTLSVVHAATWTDPEDPTRVAMFDRLLYSTQYVVVSLGETMIAPDTERAGWFYVVRLQRVRFRVGGGLAHGAIMRRVQAAMRQSLAAELEMARTVAARRHEEP